MTEPPVDEVALYRTMARIRAFETALELMAERKAIRGTAHPCTGTEAVPAGVCGALRQDDFVTSTHRGHGHALAKGLQMPRMMAEIAGRVDGYCKGRGGSMHVTSLVDGMLGADGIVGGSVGIAVGAGHTLRRRGEDRVVASFFGDGAINEGSLHEALNLAAVLASPVVFVCENNQWAMSTSIVESTRIERLSIRADAYGIPGRTVDGNDVIAVHDVAAEAVARARRGEGPTLIEAVTFRLGGHSANAPMVYASDEEVASWRERDPLALSRRRCTERDPGLAEELDAIDADAASEAEAAVEFAIASALPDARDALDDVYTPSTWLTRTAR